MAVGEASVEEGGDSKVSNEIFLSQVDACSKSVSLAGGPSKISCAFPSQSTKSPVVGAEPVTAGVVL